MKSSTKPTGRQTDGQNRAIVIA